MNQSFANEAIFVFDSFDLMIVSWGHRNIVSLMILPLIFIIYSIKLSCLIRMVAIQSVKNMFCNWLQNGISACLPWLTLSISTTLTGLTADFIRIRNYCNTTLVRKVFYTIGKCYCLIFNEMLNDRLMDYLMLRHTSLTVVGTRQKGNLSNH